MEAFAVKRFIVGSLGKLCLSLNEESSNNVHHRKSIPCVICKAQCFHENQMRNKWSSILCYFCRFYTLRVVFKHAPPANVHRPVLIVLDRKCAETGEIRTFSQLAWSRYLKQLHLGDTVYQHSVVVSLNKNTCRVKHLIAIFTEPDYKCLRKHNNDDR